MGFKKVVIETDATQIVEEMNGKQEVMGCYLLSRKVKDLLKNDWQLVVLHKYREGNRCADLLAKMSMKQRDHKTIWKTVPEFVATVVTEDLEGTRVARRCLAWVFHPKKKLNLNP